MPAPSRSSRPFLKAFVVVAVLAAAGIALFYKNRPTAYVKAVTRGAALDNVNGSVTVHADKDLQEIKSELPGRVTWIDPRQLGQPIKAGEKLVELDSADLKLAMKQAEDAYTAVVARTAIATQNDPTQKLAEQNLEIAKRRREHQEISDIELNAAENALTKVTTDLQLANHDTQQAKVKFDNDQAASKRLLDKMTICAPVDCILESVRVASGALISAGTTVATYYANGRDVIAKVSEEDIGRVKVGQKAKVRLLRLPNSTFDATVTTILPYADPDTQRYSVYLKVEASLDDLQPAATGEAAIEVGRHENQPLIERRALINDRYVMVVKDGVVEKREVKVGFRALNLAEITGNLEPGEKVIVDDVDQFHDGQHVRSVEKK
jgi:RND family efflux transporter MFP subunit